MFNKEVVKKSLLNQIDFFSFVKVCHPPLPITTTHRRPPNEGHDSYGEKLQQWKMMKKANQIRGTHTASFNELYFWELVAQNNP